MTTLPHLPDFSRATLLVNHSSGMRRAERGVRTQSRNLQRAKRTRVRVAIPFGHLLNLNPRLLAL